MGLFVCVCFFFLAGGSGDNGGFMSINSRRQSNIQRHTDADSILSLHGSTQNEREYSPKSSQRRYVDRLPLHLSGEDSQLTLDQPDSIGAEQPNILEYTLKKPLAMVRPRRILSAVKSSSSDDYNRFHSGPSIDDCPGNLRESRSLEPFPSQLRRRVDYMKLPSLKTSKHGSRSLDAGVSMISYNPNYYGMADMFNNTAPTATTTTTDNIAPDWVGCSDSATNSNKNKLSHNKYINNNCNGSIMTEDPNCPLLFRGSLNTANDDGLNYQQKRWRSLEAISIEKESSSKSKKELPRGTTTIRSWLVGLFQGSATRGADVSLRKVNAVQSGVKGMPAFCDLPPAPENESMV